MSRRRQCRARVSRRPGQALLELAIILPILLLLIFGAVDAVQIALTNYHVAQAAEAAVHEASLVGGPGSGETHEGPLSSATGTIAARARLILDAGLGTSSEHAEIRVTCDPVGCPRYAAVTVEIIYSGEVWAPIGPFSSFTATSRLTRATEQDRGSSSSTTLPPTPAPYPGGRSPNFRAPELPGEGSRIPGSRDERGTGGAQP